MLWNVFLLLYSFEKKYLKYFIYEKHKGEWKRLEGELTKEVQAQTHLGENTKEAEACQTKGSLFPSSCLQSTSVATIKALNQMIRQKHQKGLNGSSYSSLCITTHIST